MDRKTVDKHSPMITVSTSRLQLIAASTELVQAERDNRARLSELLNAKTPANWPPPLNDENSLTYTIRYLEDHPDALGWVAWYFILTVNNERLLIGNGGFKGVPTAEGTAEVGYSIMESHHRKGYATEAVKGLVDWAFQHKEVNRVIGETLPELHASISVMEKNGFTFLGRGSEEGVIRYELTRLSHNKESAK